jgi:hypothetical protein
LNIATDVIYITINESDFEDPGKYKGKLGEIANRESERTGDRQYREGKIFQSQSSASGESRIPFPRIYW